MKAPVCAFVLLLLAGCAFDLREEPKKAAPAEPIPVAESPDPQQEFKPDPNLPGFKLDMSYLDKRWGIKAKSFKLTPVQDSKQDIIFLLEFTKDVEDLKGIRQALSPVKKEETQKGYAGKKGKLRSDDEPSMDLVSDSNARLSHSGS
jgi:hypothetical protein